jgi:hypothetical protein
MHFTASHNLFDAWLAGVSVYSKVGVPLCKIFVQKQIYILYGLLKKSSS